MTTINTHLFCKDLKTSPNPEIGKILVTGATGYIGGRLVPELTARGYNVRIMVRGISPEQKERFPEVEIVEADALNKDCLYTALKGVHTAYYLIHSLLLGKKKFESADINAARNFREAANDCGLKRIVYLGGLGDIHTSLSPHLKSRTQVSEELTKGKIPVTTLRAAVIIGSGSASYEIIKHLTKNLSVLTIPRWLQTRCQPIAIRDVIKYLVGVLEVSETTGKSFDIGGPDILSYEDLLRASSEIYGKKKLYIYSPISNIRFFAYLVSLFTPVPAPITYCLMESITNEVVCKNNEIMKLVPFEPISYREALIRALGKEETDDVSTRWANAYPPSHPFATKLEELPKPAKYTCTYSILTKKPATAVFHSTCRIGGDQGWFNSNWMWILRGMIDRLLMGVGTSRGRRSSSRLRINDTIDFFRVENLIPDALLLLRAEMILPGKAWLEFKIDEKNQKNRLTVTAYYEPNGIFGIIYWYIFLPFHHYIFNDIIVQIEKRSRIRKRL